mmetsp:Transcript_15959/g.38835  ORF Transcript_15959/g.38835 Transcript_15959/m.38835 type:complete len:240 (+) Transcript_15959:1024-1743(+)
MLVQGQSKSGLGSTWRCKEVGHFFLPPERLRNDLILCERMGLHQLDVELPGPLRHGETKCLFNLGVSIVLLCQRALQLAPRGHREVELVGPGEPPAWEVGGPHDGDQQRCRRRRRSLQPLLAQLPPHGPRQLLSRLDKRLAIHLAAPLLLLPHVHPHVQDLVPAHLAHLPKECVHLFPRGHPLALPVHVIKHIFGSSGSPWGCFLRRLGGHLDGCRLRIFCEGAMARGTVDRRSDHGSS